MLQMAKVGEELEVFEQNGKFHFKVKGTEPPQVRCWTIDRNIDVQLSTGKKYSLISGHPGLLLSIEEQEKTDYEKEYDLPASTKGVHYSFRQVFVPGTCFKILS